MLETTGIANCMIIKAKLRQSYLRKRTESPCCGFSNTMLHHKAELAVQGPREEMFKNILQNLLLILE